MAKPTDIRIVDFSLQFIPVQTRMPLKFGTEVLSSVTCARVCVIVENNLGQKVEGWGETPVLLQETHPQDPPPKKCGESSDLLHGLHSFVGP